MVDIRVMYGLYNTREWTRRDSHVIDCELGYRFTKIMEINKE